MFRVLITNSHLLKRVFLKICSEVFALKFACVGENKIEMKDSNWEIKLRLMIRNEYTLK